MLKKVVKNYVPRNVLDAIERWHFARALPKFDEPELAVVRLLAECGTTVVDVGANVGWYTYAMSKIVGPNGSVVSLEPVNRSFQYLQHCIRTHSLTNVESHHIAASASPGKAEILIPRGRDGTSNFYRAKLTSKVTTNAECYATEVVQTDTLDRILQSRLDKVSFVKIDVEGHELAVVSGAKSLLESRNTSWMIELSGDPERVDSSAAKVNAVLDNHGYRGFWFDDNSRILRKLGQGEKIVNYFFLTDEQLMRIRLPHE